AEVFGISTDQIIYLELDTGTTPDSGPTVASRATLMGGGAVKATAEILRKRLEELIRNEWKLKPDDEIVFRDNKIFSISNSSPRETRVEAGQFAIFSDICKLAYQRGISLATIGLYKSPSVGWDEHVGQGDAYFTYVYG
ncbi:MAG: molybdopterin-dependent oxidoreductase, partial [Bacteroidetes bacterium]|nr:molybdopterin-dependent oxidoreductase [Bacteroidota bacterium]